MIKKTLGIVLSVLGLIGIASYSIPSVKTAIPYITDVPVLPLVIVSLGLLVVGLFITVKSGGGRRGKQPAEVPIYHGKHVVGYRRMK